jgi:short-subunit dehydrogenase
MALPLPTPDATVVVTGASSGIGSELARELARRSYNVTLVARRRARLDELADELITGHGVEVDVRTADLGDAEGRRELIERVLADGERTVIGLCNNAGFGSLGTFHELPLERETEMVRLNVEAAHELTGAVLPRFVERGAGAVLNVASVAAFQPIPRMATYAATKAFLLSFSEALHEELSGTGVSVTALCPGPVRTEFNSVAGVERGGGPSVDFLFQVPAPAVARAAVNGMVAGKRGVVPGLGPKGLAVTGRLSPRSVLLPVTRIFGAERMLE